MFLSLILFLIGTLGFLSTSYRFPILIVLFLLALIFSGFFGRKLGVNGSQLITCTSLIMVTIFSVLAFIEVGINNIPVSLLWSFSIYFLTVSMLIPVLIISSLAYLYFIGYISYDLYNQRFLKKNLEFFSKKLGVNWLQLINSALCRIKSIFANFINGYFSHNVFIKIAIISLILPVKVIINFIGINEYSFIMAYICLVIVGLISIIISNLYRNKDVFTLTCLLLVSVRCTIIFILSLIFKDCTFLYEIINWFLFIDFNLSIFSIRPLIHETSLSIIEKLSTEDQLRKAFDDVKELIIRNDENMEKWHQEFEKSYRKHAKSKFEKGTSEYSKTFGKVIMAKLELGFCSDRYEDLCGKKDFIIKRATEKFPSTTEDLNKYKDVEEIVEGGTVNAMIAKTLLTNNKWSIR